MEGTYGSLSSNLLLKAEPALNTVPGDLLPRLSVPGLFQENAICHNDLLSAMGHPLKGHHCSPVQQEHSASCLRALILPQKQDNGLVWDDSHNHLHYS